MRFVKDTQDGLFVVLDSLTGRVYGKTKEEAAVDRFVKELNNKFPDKVPSRQWVMEITDKENSDELLNLGFEPFAANGSLIYFKKQVTPRA